MLPQMEISVARGGLSDGLLGEAALYRRVPDYWAAERRADVVPHLEHSRA